MSAEEKYSYVDIAGRTVHVFDDGFGGESKLIEYNMFDDIFHGEQYCPYCLRSIEHLDGYWQCSVCGWNIDDDEVSSTNGIPSLGAALDYREEYGLGPV